MSFPQRSISPSQPRGIVHGPQLLPHMQHPLSTHHVSLTSLPEFIREHNRSSSPYYGAVVRVWSDPSITGSRRKQIVLRTGVPFIVRVTLPNIFHAAIKLASSSTMDAPLRVMTVSCTGFNEGVSEQHYKPKIQLRLPSQKPHHATSDFAVFRVVSQNVMRPVSERPSISLTLLIV